MQQRSGLSNRFGPNPEILVEKLRGRQTNSLSEGRHLLGKRVCQLNLDFRFIWQSVLNPSGAKPNALPDAPIAEKERSWTELTDNRS